MKRALVTGGSRGIGLCIAKTLAQQGYAVTATYLNTTAQLDELRAMGVAPVRCDVTNPDDVQAAVEAAGAVDVLVNNAGIAQVKPFADLTIGDWNAMLAANLTSAFLVSRAVLPKMISRKSGCIVNISSIWGEVGGSCEVHYSAAKAGLIGLTKALAKELGPSGIRVNAIAPGYIDTDMNAELTDADRAEVLAQTPLNVAGLPSQVANAVLYLAQNDFVTADVLHVDGGFAR